MNEAERESLIADGWRDKLGHQFFSKDLTRGENILFAATGISTGPLLRGVQVQGTVATTHSVLMRARSGTVRFIEAQHNLSRKTVHLRSTQTENPV